MSNTASQKRAIMPEKPKLDSLETMIERQAEDQNERLDTNIDDLLEAKL